jgi:1,4-dihydroxy-2-naphthoyl-CoA hydrolase
MDHLALLEGRPMPFAVLLGVRYLSAAPERVTGELIVRPDLCTLGGAMHGGAMMAFADTLGAAATFLNLPEGSSTTTIESKTNFIAAAAMGAKVIGECLPFHRGRRTMVWQTKLSTEEGRLIAVISQTQMVLEPRPAKA